MEGLEGEAVLADGDVDLSDAAQEQNLAVALHGLSIRGLAGNRIASFSVAAACFFGAEGKGKMLLFQLDLCSCDRVWVRVCCRWSFLTTDGNWRGGWRGRRVTD